MPFVNLAFARSRESELFFFTKLECANIILSKNARIAASMHPKDHLGEDCS